MMEPLRLHPLLSVCCAASMRVLANYLHNKTGSHYRSAKIVRAFKFLEFKMYCNMQHCTAPYSTALHHTVPYCTTQHRCCYANIVCIFIKVSQLITYRGCTRGSSGSKNNCNTLCLALGSERRQKSTLNADTGGARRTSDIGIHFQFGTYCSAGQGRAGQGRAGKGRACQVTLCRKQFSVEPLTLLRFYSVEPGQQSGEMDTLQIHLVGNYNFSCCKVFHLLQIRKND